MTEIVIPGEFLGRRMVSAAYRKGYTAAMNGESDSCPYAENPVRRNGFLVAAVDAWRQGYWRGLAVKTTEEMRAKRSAATTTAGGGFVTDAP